MRSLWVPRVSRCDSGRTMSAELVVPPPELATIIDKTAQFVARNGPEFETRIRNEQKNAKFSFLQPNDPFHPLRGSARPVERSIQPVERPPQVPG